MILPSPMHISLHNKNKTIIPLLNQIYYIYLLILSNSPQHHHPHHLSLHIINFLSYNIEGKLIKEDGERWRCGSIRVHGDSAVRLCWYEYHSKIGNGYRNESFCGSCISPTFCYAFYCSSCLLHGEVSIYLSIYLFICMYVCLIIFSNFSSSSNLIVGHEIGIRYGTIKISIYLCTYKYKLCFLQ